MTTDANQPGPHDPEQDQAASAAMQQLTNSIAQDLSRGIKPARIIKALTKQGIDEPTATGLVNEVVLAIQAYKESPEGRERMARKHFKHIWIGLAWCIGGTVITVATYGAASKGGGHYVVAWGAILFGGIEALYGFFGWMKHR